MVALLPIVLSVAAAAAAAPPTATVTWNSLQWETRAVEPGQPQRLAENLVVFPARCQDALSDVVTAYSAVDQSDKRRLAFLDDSERSMFPPQLDCHLSAACLDVGTQRGLLHTPFFATWNSHNGMHDSEGQLLPRPAALATKELIDWVSFRCFNKEVAWVNNLGHGVDFYWIVEATGKASFRGSAPATPLRPASEAGSSEPNEGRHFSQNTRLGHRWEVWKSGSKEASKEVVWSSAVDRDLYISLGAVPDLPAGWDQNASYYKSLVSGMRYEWETRLPEQIPATGTFSAGLGFQKGVMPQQLWSSIEAYYSNNRAHGFYRENSRDQYQALIARHAEILPLCHNLKLSWAAALKPTVEEWCNVKRLEQTSVYGIRKYHPGARLRPHVDRPTHVCSAIINVDQIMADAEAEARAVSWPVAIWDYAGNGLNGLPGRPTDEVHGPNAWYGDAPYEVETGIGELLLYESATCMHGRPALLEDASFVNVFVHYHVTDGQKRRQPADEL